MKLDDLVGKYILLRDRRAKRKAEYEAEDSSDKALQDKIEALMLHKFQETGVESVKTAHGTAYTTTRTSATVVDWDAFFSFVQEESAWEMLEHRCSKTAVEQYRGANSVIPPGLNWSETRVVNFRRA